MNTQDYYKKRNTYHFYISKLKSDIEIAKKNNQDRENLQERCDSIRNLSRDLTDYLNKLKVIQSRAIKENDDFRTRRLNLLSVQISDVLEKVLKDKFLQAEVSCNFNRTNSVRVTLTDSMGNTFNPAMCNGMLVQYLISYSGASCITKTLGINSLFIDEAFGVSSMDNLPIIGELLGDAVKDGTFIILVSQNPALYRDLPRHEIHLETDLKRNCAKVVKEVDYSETGGK